MKSLALRIFLLVVGGVLSQSCIRISDSELEGQHSRLSQVKSSLSGFESEIYESAVLVINLSKNMVGAFSYTPVQNRRKKDAYDICIDYKNLFLVQRTLDGGAQANIEVNFNNASVVNYCNDIKKKKTDRDYEVEMRINFPSKKKFLHKIKIHIVEKPTKFVLLLSGRGFLMSDSNKKDILIDQNALVEIGLVDGSLILADQKLKIEFSSDGKTYFSEIDMHMNDSRVSLDRGYFKLIRKKDNIKIGYLKFSKRSSQEIEVYDVNKKLIISSI